MTALVPPEPLPIIAAPGMKSLCIIDLNMSGSEAMNGQIEPITSYIASMAAKNVTVITLQEVCANQHTAILNALGSSWVGSFKAFGPMPGCHGRRHGLSVLTKGQHDKLDWWHLPPKDPYEGKKWWGVMKVRYRGVDIYSTHIRSANSSEQTLRVQSVVEDAGGKAVVAGDFNQVPSSPRIRSLYKVWFECDPYRQPTWQKKKYDYIWATWRPFQISGGSLDSPSNHKLVWAVFRWR
jgi:endonuclease/exonuclease/phosphatase family metal-dependent hydrolase